MTETREVEGLAMSGLVPPETQKRWAEKVAAAASRPNEDVPDGSWRAGRYKIPEGYMMTTWPSFTRLMDRLRVTLPKIDIPKKWKTPGYDERVVIDVPSPTDTVKVTVNGAMTDTGVLCTEAWKFPEFRAYCELLGIPWDQWALSLRIEFAFGEFPSYTLRAALSVPKDAPFAETPGL